MSLVPIGSKLPTRVGSSGPFSASEKGHALRRQKGNYGFAAEMLTTFAEATEALIGEDLLRSGCQSSPLAGGVP